MLLADWSICWLVYSAILKIEFFFNDDLTFVAVVFVFFETFFLVRVLSNCLLNRGAFSRQYTTRKNIQGIKKCVDAKAAGIVGSCNVIIVVVRRSGVDSGKCKIFGLEH